MKKKKDIEFEAKLNHARRLNLINALIAECEKLLGKSRFEKKYIAIVNRLKEAEKKYMPSVKDTYEKKGLDEAISLYEEIGLFFEPPDLKKLGLHRLKKQIPRGKELLNYYKNTLSEVKSKLKKRYNNLNSKNLDIKDKFNIPIDKIKEWPQKLTPTEIAHHILGYRYGVSPFTVKNLLRKK